jgi:hypothetical protein
VGGEKVEGELGWDALGLGFLSCRRFLNSLDTHSAPRSHAEYRYTEPDYSKVGNIAGRCIAACFQPSVLTNLIHAAVTRTATNLCQFSRPTSHWCDELPHQPSVYPTILLSTHAEFLYGRAAEAKERKSRRIAATSTDCDYVPAKERRCITAILADARTADLAREPTRSMLRR